MGNFKVNLLPNPFSDSTIISFYLPGEEKVSIDIFNSSIETVKKIEDINCKYLYIFKFIAMYSK